MFTDLFRDVRYLVCSSNGFEIYGLKRNKQIVTLINQGPKMEEMLMVKVLQVSGILYMVAAKTLNGF